VGSKYNWKLHECVDCNIINDTVTDEIEKVTDQVEIVMHEVEVLIY